MHFFQRIIASLLRHCNPWLQNKTTQLHSFVPQAITILSNSPAKFATCNNTTMLSNKQAQTSSIVRRVETISQHISHEPTSGKYKSNTKNMTSTKAPLRVAVTGAAGQISYSLLPMIAQGLMFGNDQPLILQLLEVAGYEPAWKSLGGVVFELQDGAFPLLHQIIPTTDPLVAFKDADVAILVGAFPRKEGMERADLLAKNAAIFKEQGTALDKVAKKTVKVLVVGNPANTNAMIAQHYAPSIPKQNFSALTRLDHNRAKAQVSLKLNVPVANVHNVIIWGNHSSTQYPDVNHGFVVQDNTQQAIRQAINDDTYLNTQFIATVQKRGAAIIEARKFSSALSAAQAIVDHVKNWFLGTPEGEFVSMAVSSDGSYGIKEGVIYSYPVTCKNGEYTIVQGLKIDDFSRGKMDLTAAELFDERKTSLEMLSK